MSLTRKFHILMLAACVTGGWLGSAAVRGQAVAPANSPDLPQVDLAKKPAYWRDARLEATVSFPEPAHAASRRAPSLFLAPPSPEEARAGTNAPPRIVRLIRGRIIPAAELLKAIHDKTGVTLVLAGEWGHRVLAVPAQGAPVRELMDGMALTVRDRIPNRWIAIDADTWVLARGQREAAWAMMPPEKRKALREENVRILLTGLKEAQWSRLKQGMPLTMPMLPPAQREALVWILRLLYFDPETPDERLPTAGGEIDLAATLRLVGEGKDARLVIEGAGYGSSDTFSDPIPFYDAATGALIWGVAPPR